jgi:hypothetical protein
MGWDLLLLVGLLIGVLTGQARAAAAPPTQVHRQGAGPRQAAYLGAHSMLYLNTPFSAMKVMFAQAAAMGASFIRLDVELSAVFPKPSHGLAGTAGHLLAGTGRHPPRALRDGPPPANWTEVNQYMSLARRYHLHVLADLLSTPGYLADCPSHTRRSQQGRCPPRDPEQWGRDAGEVAAHTRGVINSFEIINEPDGPNFRGTPQQYAAVLSASYRAIHAANPAAQVVLGGLRHIGSQGRRWMDAVLATRRADALHSFDVANIHVRVPPAQAGGVVCGWRIYFEQKGFRGPLWVTETGYPANPAQQKDPGYQDGPPAQARWLAEVIPSMLRAGAAKVFVTERDWGGGPFATEGVLNTATRLRSHPWFIRRPSFYTVWWQVEEGWLTMMSRFMRSPFGRTASQTIAGAGC